MTAISAAAPARPARTARRPRILWLDVARGLAIAAMVVYHFSFDLVFFGFTDWPVVSHPGWRAFAAGIASTFLFLVGVGLVVAYGDGIRWRHFLRRLLVIASAAALVTVATSFAMPYPITFGILHAIATFSVLALPFLALPPVLTLAAAAIVFVLPFVFRDDVFSAGWLVPFGLAPVPPITFDYEPIFPWFSALLLGVAFARAFPQRLPTLPAPAWAAVMARVGRNSLAIYLLHQPVLFAILAVVQRIT